MGSAPVRIDTALDNVKRLGIDSVILIYYIESNPTYVERARAVFNTIQDVPISAFTSTITIAEVFNKPLQLGQASTLRAYREALLSAKELTLVRVDASLSYRAAQLRATYNLRTPDAIQIATALESRCDAFLTNDMALKRVTDLRVLVLDELQVK
jgi:predicted nucleic acid-binding protein